MPRYYVSIDGFSQGGDTTDLRRSSLELSSSTQGLRVVGNLPHGYEFSPTDDESARLLIDYLERWLERCPFCELPADNGHTEGCPENNR
jgi:hypothetical protein